MIKSIWWVMGYSDELLEEADERQTHLKHMVCRQIKESTVMLKRVKYADDVLLNYELKYKKVSYKRKRKNIIDSIIKEI